MRKFAFSAPETKQELFDIVAANADMEIEFLAGGTDLVPMINMEKEEIPYEEKKPMMIVSLEKLGLAGISEADGCIEIGAMTTIEQIQDSELIREKMPALGAAADKLAGFAIRNTATVGGNIMNASPAADTVPPLMAMGAKVVTESAEGEEVMDLADFMTGPKMTAIKPGAILTKIVVCPGSGGCGFVKIGRRAAETLSVVNAAAYVEAEDGVCTKACVVVGSCAPTAVVCKEASESLVGKKIDQAVIDEAVKSIDAVIAPIDDVRSSAWYRREVAPVAAGRAIAAACGL